MENLELELEKNRQTEIVEPYNLPDGWKWTSAKEIADIYTGNSINEKVKAEKYAGQKRGLNFIGTKDVDFDGSINYENGVKITDFENFKTAPENTALLCIEGGSAGKKLGFTEEKVCFGNKLCAFVSKSIEPKLIYYYLQSNVFFYCFMKKRHGLIGGVSVNTLKQIPFPLPPTLAEQQRIVNRIETMFAKLDQAQKKAQSVLDSFETRKAAILHKAFTGELTANWRKENGVADDSWEEKRLEDVCDFITKGTTPKKEDMYIGNGDIPYIKVYNLCFDTKLDFTIDPTFVKLESHKNFLARSITLPGDVLMNIVGPPFGKVSIVPDSYPEWNINQAIARFRCKSELYNVYLANYLISPKTIENMSRQIKTTAGQQNLTLEICRNITIHIPTLPEQQEIVRILDAVLEKETCAKEAAQTVLDQIALLKKSILARAFRGEI